MIPAAIARPSSVSRNVLAPATVLFLVMVAHAILETARDALFLTRLGADRLGWAYVTIAALALLAVASVRRSQRVREARPLLLVFLLLAVAGTSILAFALTQTAWAAFALYVWTGLVATLTVPAFWLVIQRDLRIGEAKRVLASIAAGGGIGALVGSAIASVLGRLVEPHHLVTAGAIVFGLAAISVQLLPTGAASPELEPVAADEPRRPSARSRRYGHVLLALALVSTIALTIGDVMFKRLLAERVPGDQLTTVFGITYTGLNVVALVIQLAVTPRLLERIGVGSALAVLPALLLTTALGFVVTGATVAVFALKLADGGLRNSVHRIVLEILFVPMHAAERARAKTMIEAIGQRGGQALAAVVVLIIGGDAHATWSLAIATTAAVACWLAVVVMLRRAYVARFRDALDAAGIHREARIPMLDGASIELLIAALASPDEREALAALDLLVERGKRVPALVLYHPSDAVVRHALSLLEGDLRPDVARVLGQLTSHHDPQIRAAALAASTRAGLHLGPLSAALADDEPDVRAAAAVGLLTMRVTPRRDHIVVRARVVLDAMREGTPSERAALAGAIARRPDPRFRDLLVQLATRKHPATLRGVLRAWAAAPHLADQERLLRLLELPHVRGDVRRVFLRGGDAFLARLLDALDDPRTSLGVRRHLPRTIGRFKTPAAVDALVARLTREPDGATEFKILRALGRLTADDPDLALDPGPVRAYLRRSLEDATRYAQLASALVLHRPPADLASSELLRELLVEKRRHAIERAFRALGILHPRDDLRSLHDALVGDDGDQREAAREILEHLLPADVRAPLLALLEQPASAEAEVRAQYPAYADVMTALLADPSDMLRCVTAHHVAERKLVELVDELVRLQPVTGSRLVTESFEQAIARLHV